MTVIEEKATWSVPRLEKQRKQERIKGYCTFHSDKNSMIHRPWHQSWISCYNVLPDSTIAPIREPKVVAADCQGADLVISPCLLLYKMKQGKEKHAGEVKSLHRIFQTFNKIVRRQNFTESAKVEMRQLTICQKVIRWQLLQWEPKRHHFRLMGKKT